MWKLVIEDDEGKRTVVPLTRSVYSLGRKEGNTIRLTERNVSREHAKLKKTREEEEGQFGCPYILEDCASYNGIYVNGLRVAETQELEHGDLIQIGDYRIILQDTTDEQVVPLDDDGKATLPMGARGSLLLERPNRLVMLAGPSPGAEFPLDRDRTTIGRAEESHISVNHNSVSRPHCEVHALGEGRFEIVDKGSSNGVRVNGADLRRGIIEAGDVIELGDVRFRLVGAGQVFLPGVSESQQFTVIGQRSSRAQRGAGGGSVWPYVLLGALVAGAAVGTWAYAQRTRAPLVTVPSYAADAAAFDTAPAYPERDLRPVVRAEVLDAAAARDERADAATLMQPPGAKGEPSPTSRRPGESTAVAPPSPATHTAPVSTPPASHSATASTTSSMAPQARALMLQDPTAARALLEPRVWGGRGTAEEVELLRRICKDQRDRVCVENCRRLQGQ